jgi:hypothetical protein
VILPVGQRQGSPDAEVRPVRAVVQLEGPVELGQGVGVPVQAEENVGPGPGRVAAEFAGLGPSLRRPDQGFERGQHPGERVQGLGEPAGVGVPEGALDLAIRRP